MLTLRRRALVARVSSKRMWLRCALQAERKLEFSLNHPTSAKKDAVYYIDVTVVSKKFKLSTKQRFNIHFKAISGAS